MGMVIFDDVKPISNGDVMRSAIPVGTVFRRKDSKKNIIRAAVGNNSCNYSFNLNDECISWSSKDYPVDVLGTFTWNITLCPDKQTLTVDGKECGDCVTRDAVEVGEVFQGRNSGRLYLHLGFEQDGRPFSVPLDSSGNHAITNNEEREVFIVGYAKLVVNLLKNEQ